MMTAGVDADLWLQLRRVAMTKGQIAALDEIRLRLIEMSDLFAANAVAERLDGLRNELDYQRHVLVAMQARMAVKRVDQSRAA
jgi:hypothetical protein